jgi:cell division protein FtsX
MWKKWAIWFRGAVIGLIVALIISAGLGTDTILLNNLASPGVISCQLLTECSNCIACYIVGLIFNLIYGFLIGGMIGWLINKFFIRENKVKRKRGMK